MMGIEGKRLLSETEAYTYCGLSRTYFRKWALEIGALRRIGKRVLYDKKVIDDYIDNEAPATYSKRTKQGEGQN